ncbi:MAG: chromosome segregation protein SMC [Phycisphaeraceae bacterium]|nr:chromosome segregation protein SMC [Phycisphaeraceae bacterium]
MRLAKLSLCGFKSFADATEFTFDDAITGIVGPNGCGKSNVVDAIKWVLGERSSKSLRGKEMLDVIFAGSAGRQPAGMASVSLTFENPVVDLETDGTGMKGAERRWDEGEGDHGQIQEAGDAEEEGDSGVVEASVRARRALPFDADVVEVERRLYRDGTSQYLINGRRARLKDIRDLFLDTGIGADAYSIIEQGKVDAMLLSNPMERRSIFEEAAGIARYRQRRIEAERKLDRTESNLVQSREQLASTERRLRIVRGQAAKAVKFREFDAELSAWRTALAHRQYHEVRERLSGLTSRLAALERDRDSARETLAELEALRQDAELERGELLEARRRLEADRSRAEQTIHGAEQRRVVLERSIDDERGRARADRARSEDLERRITELDGQIEACQRRVDELAREAGNAELRLRKAGEERAAIAEELGEAQASLSQRRATLASIERERMGLMASVEADDRQRHDLEDQRGRIEARRSALQHDAEELDRVAGALAETIVVRERAIETLVGEVEARTGELESAESGRGALVRGLTESERERAAQDSRRRTLEEMVAGHEGLGDAVREVLSRRDAGSGFLGVIAPLAELIETDAAHAGVVEAALGESLRALVTPTVSTLPSDGELAALSGRVTLLPVAGLGSRVAGSGGVVPGVECVADLVRPTRRQATPAGLPMLIDRLLGRTFVATSVESALLLSAGPMAGARFVTAKGEVLEADGRVQAGPESGERGAGVLQRASELRDLVVALEHLDRDIAARRLELERADARAATIAAERSRVQAALSDEQRALVSERARMERFEADRTRMRREGAGLESETAQMDERLARLAGDRARLVERAESLQRLHDEQTSLCAGIERELERLRARHESVGEELTAAKVEVGRLGEQAQGARREHGAQCVARDESIRQHRDLLGQIERGEQRILELDLSIEQTREAIESASAEIVDVEDRIERLAEELARADANVRQVVEHTLAARERCDQVERDWQSLEISRREVEVRREGLESRAEEEAGLDLAREHGEYVELIRGGVAPADEREAQERISELREAIRSLGNVNLDAIEEAEHLETQNETLVAQVADLDHARVTLTSLIARLNEVSRTQFQEAFARIQEEFAGDSGMFRRLFGGGKAELRLLPVVREVDGQRVVTDEIDPLESGIDVLAKPPGKEPRSISQLSGGEKTMTAVALLLSIFRSRPSCFCVLDEVDAALDESNVDRFAHVIRQFTDLSHFIVITHNKRTMHGADRLYGVTMQERGVSKRVSVRFEEEATDRPESTRAGAAATDAEDTPAKTNGRGRRKAAVVEVKGTSGEPETGPPSPSRRLREALAGMRNGSEAEPVGGEQAGR